MPPLLSRRAFGLTAGLALVATPLSGCSFFDPTVHGSAVRNLPRPSPTPEQAQVNALAGNESLTAALQVLRTATGATPAEVAWTTAVQRALQLQRRVLLRPDPLSGALGDDPMASGSPRTTGARVPAVRATDELATLATAEAATLLTVALSAETGPDALLWGSLSVFASASAQPAPHPPVDHGVVPFSFESESLGSAQSVLVEHLFRADQALAALVGALRPGSLRTQLAQRRGLLVQQRVDLQATMRAAGATPPPPEPGYELPIRPAAGTVAAVMATIETDLFNAAAGVFCATPATDEARTAAHAAWLTQLPQVTRWTGVSWFPGWV
ncbi:DUF4439 domain-containing protein [Aestuariimicrobium kwangyangense]|uniref:DUF4439 domain-containing protein n=1 Tax=Aestuariimicrobium kwangyangense TaxID=396389 RepID=UPI0003B48CAD|nr:DUF4439 domain-containing protein [Aestuariimicrobium kwangyangense]